jgi:PAS domain S-box-containing protein
MILQMTPAALRARIPVAAIHGQILGILEAAKRDPEYSMCSEYDIVRPDGQRRIVQSTYFAIHSPSGFALGDILRDVTAERLAEAAMRESEAKLKVILESVQAGVMVIDPETHLILDANPAAVSLIGAPLEEVVGSVCHKFFPASMGKCPVTDLGQSVDNSERVLLTAGGGECPIIKTVVPVTLAGRKHLLETFVDIAALKKGEVQIRDQLDELQRWQAVMLDREGRVQELKREVNVLCRRAGEAVRYPSQEGGAADAEVVEAKP